MREDTLQPRRAKGREAGTLRGSRPVACPSASRSPGQGTQAREPRAVSPRALPVPGRHPLHALRQGL